MTDTNILKIKKKKKSPIKSIKPGVKPIHKSSVKTSALSEAEKRRLRRGKPHNLKANLAL